MEDKTRKSHRQFLDKLNRHSNRIFSKTYAQNLTYDSKLSAVVRKLEKRRDLNIRNSHEKIWKVSSQDFHIPKLPKNKNQPYYLGKQRSVSLPTPTELSLLLPRAVARKKRASLTRYQQVSTRRLSDVGADDIQIFHYRHILGKEGREKPTSYAMLDVDTKCKNIIIHQQLFPNAQKTTETPPIKLPCSNDAETVNNNIRGAPPPAKRKLRRQSTVETLTTVNSVKEVTVLARQLQISTTNSDQVVQKNKYSQAPSKSSHPDVAGFAAKNTNKMEVKFSETLKASKSSYIEMCKRQLTEYKRNQTGTLNVSAADRVSNHFRDMRSQLLSAPISRVQTTKPAKETLAVRPKSTGSTIKVSP
ncbi:uncharacterized protein LOC117118984 [Anneissia japonica]|uniref:uncharacterized protein LOC117118984 n=1 Tax=Anneissia japonica TaxID=1529436 RepID=UPI001425A0E4|nr:uncharacterized protein LOC117118984 [Anneissia japonica]